MMMKKTLYRRRSFGLFSALVLVFLSLLTIQCTTETVSAVVTSDPEFPLEPPDSAEAFYPEVLCTDYRPHGAFTFNPEMTKAWWSVYTPNATQFHQSIAEATFDSLQFSAITLMDVSSGYSAGGVVPANDGSRLYLNLNAPVEEGGTSVMNLWYVDWADTGWSAPTHLDIPVLGSYIGSQFTIGPEEGSFIVTMREDGASNDLYMTQRVEADTFSTPVKLPETINSSNVEADSWYDPVSELLLFMSDSRGDTYGAADLYASKYLGDGEWSEAVNLGDKINTSGYERFPAVTPDGSCLFFVRDYTSSGVTKHEFFWVSMETVKALVE